MRALALPVMFAALTLPVFAQAQAMPVFAQAQTAPVFAQAQTAPVFAQAQTMSTLPLSSPEMAEGDEAVPDRKDDPATAGAVTDITGTQTRDPTGQSLADMQASLREVAADLQALRAELLASGAPGFAAAGGDSAIDRMNAMEAQLATLTGLTEQLSNRIRRVVADGSNRVGDIEFRLCELDENCDLGALMTADLGSRGDQSVPGPGPAPQRDSGGDGGVSSGSAISTTLLPPLTQTAPAPTPPTEEEAREFNQARATMKAGQWDDAIAQLDHLVSAHAGGPLTADSLFLRGAAQQAAGRVPDAAESWLRSFGADPGGRRAPASLMALSRALAALGTPRDACPYLSELTRRFPDAPETAEAKLATDFAECAVLTGAGDDPVAGEAVGD